MPRSQENAFPYDPTVGLCLGPTIVPGEERFLIIEASLYLAHDGPCTQHIPPLRTDDVYPETPARHRAVELSSGSNDIPRRARPGLAGPRPPPPSPQQLGGAGHFGGQVFDRFGPRMLQRYLAHTKPPTPLGPP